jgi:aspartyl protease family protein
MKSRKVFSGFDRHRAPRRSLAWIALALAVPAVAPKAEPVPARANGPVPFIGETAAEFEARIQGRARIRAAARDFSVLADRTGHFVVAPTMNGRNVRMLVDTGATLVVLSYEDAHAIGLRPEPREFNRKSDTANGSVDTALTRIAEIQLGNIVVRDVEAAVLPPGRAAISLLGMSFLRRLRGFEVSEGKLLLRE